MTIEPLIEHIGEGMIRVTRQDDRWYRDDKRVWVPNTTGITGTYPKGEGFKRYLINQPSPAHQEYELKVAGDRGSKVHAACEQIALGHPVSYEEYHDVWKYVQAFRSFWELHDPEVVDVEFVVWGKRKRRRYAGTADLLCWIDGHLWVLDWKTSKDVWRSHEIQVAAYAHAIRQSRPELFVNEPVFHAGVVVLGTKHKRTKKFAYGPGYRFVESNILNDLTIFDACYTLWEDNDPPTPPMPYELEEVIQLEVKRWSSS